MADGSGNPQSMLQQLAQLYGGPLAIPAVQRSQYVAQALQAMQQNRPELRTPGSLASNLMAEALLNFGRARSDRELMKATQGGIAAQQGAYSDIDALTHPAQDQSSASPAGSPATAIAQMLGQSAGADVGTSLGARFMAHALAGTSPAALGAGGGAAAGGAGGSPSPADPTAPAALAASAPPPAPPWQATLAHIRQDPRGFFSGVLGEPATITSAQRSPGHNAAVGGSRTSEHLTNSAWDIAAPGMSSTQIAQRLAAAGLPYDQIIDEGNHAHFGIGPTGRERGEVLQQTGPGQYRPFAPPQSAPPTNAGPAQPPMPQGGLQVGGQNAPMPSPQPQGAPPQGQGPFQIGGQSAPLPAPQGQQQPQPSGQQQFGQPGFRAQPASVPPQMLQQWAALRQRFQQNPMLYGQQFQALTDQIHEIMRNPEEMLPQFNRETGETQFFGKQTGMLYGTQRGDARAGPIMRPDGQGGYAPVPSTQTVQLPPGAPGDNAQLNRATGAISHEAIPNAVEGRTVYDPAQNRYVPLNGLQPQIGGGPVGTGPMPGAPSVPPPQGATQPGLAHGTVTQFDPMNGQTSILQGPSEGGRITEQALQERGKSFASDAVVQGARESVAAVQGLAGVLGKVGGAAETQAALDTYIKGVSAPNAQVRQGPVQVQMEHQNLVQAIGGEYQRLLTANGGFMTPQAKIQLGRAAWAYAKSRVDEAAKLDATNRQLAQAAGLDPRMLGEDAPIMPDVPPSMRDDPRQLPPPAQRKPGMVAWGLKGPMTWNGRAWVTQ